MSVPPSAYIIVSGIFGVGTTNPPPGVHEYPYPYPTVNLTATAAPTWHFSRWIINGQTFTDNPHSVSLSMGSVYDVKAYFEQDAPPQYVLSISSNVGGVTDPPNGSYTYDEGTVVNVTALPAAGFVFDYWVYDVISYANPISITINENRTLYPFFKSSAPPPPTQYDLAIFQGANGTTDPPNGHYLYNVGAVVSVTALPNSGYVFDYWVYDAGGTRYTNPISIVMDGNHAVTPYFKLASSPPPPPVPNVSLVTVSVAGQGSTDPMVGEHAYTLGATLYVVGTPATGWHYTKMRRNGVDWTSANPGEFQNLAATETIEVVFEQDTTPPPNGGDEPRPIWLYVVVPVGVLFAVGLGYYFLKKKR